VQEPVLPLQMPITPAPTPTPEPIRPYNQEELMPADDLDQTTLLETEEDLNQQVINGLLIIDSYFIHSTF